MSKINLIVRSKTKVATISSKNKMWDWRKAVANEARRYRESISYTQQNDTDIFDVKIIFYLHKNCYQRCDLDNLAKPVIDTLFCTQKKPIQNSVCECTLFDVNDKGINSLCMEKKMGISEDEMGADIIISW